MRQLFTGFIVFILFLITTAQISAQCTGVFRCGIAHDECTCSDGGSLCSKAGRECGKDGTCQCNTNCDPKSGGNISCSGSTQSSCYSASCGGFEACVETNYCEWNGVPNPDPGGGGGEEPAPTPKPPVCDYDLTGITAPDKVYVGFTHQFEFFAKAKRATIKKLETYHQGLSGYRLENPTDFNSYSNRIDPEGTVATISASSYQKYYRFTEPSSGTITLKGYISGRKKPLCETSISVKPIIPNTDVIVRLFESDGACTPSFHKRVPFSGTINLTDFDPVTFSAYVPPAPTPTPTRTPTPKPTPKPSFPSPPPDLTENGLIPSPLPGDLGQATNNPYTFKDVTRQKDRILTIQWDDTNWLPAPGCGPISRSLLRDTDVPFEETRTFDFYFTRRATPWFQVLGADIYAADGAQNYIPTSLTNQYTLGHLSSSPASSGVLLSSLPLRPNDINFLAPPNRTWSATSKQGLMSQKYDYFLSLSQLGLPQDSWGKSGQDITVISLDPDQASKIEDSDNSQLYFHQGNLILDGLSLSNNQKATLFVDGNVRVEDNITLGSSSFFGLIVKGSINFGPQVTQVQGVFLADHVLTVEAATLPDQQFVGQGVFVGWQGVSLNRKLSLEPTQTHDNTRPANQFIYRPDLILNAPVSLKRSPIRWREISP